ncbi:DciA family protein [Acidiferrobacter sp. SPIII_3]|uniref:DciA family protein n=1 Tax=Acidiferrobacter sp. SPIII_3 TaxID=1281578 RepID=UPI0011AB5893|nr:DciA family protein [Acidiferrobacter sp. SPIII_3]
MQAIVRILDRSLPRPPADLIQGPALGALWARCRPEGLRAVEALFYCRGRLFVVAPGSAQAARLRQETPDLLVRLRAEPGLGALREIVVRRVGWEVARSRGSEGRPVRSAVGSRCFESLAEVVCDAPLKASLTRLASALASGSTEDTRRA